MTAGRFGVSKISVVQENPIGAKDRFEVEDGLTL